MCSKALAFGLDVLASDPYVSADETAKQGATLVDMGTLLRQCDFVTLHSPLIPETQNLISKEELESMKPEAFLINAARGPLIDEDALYSALTEGQIAGAGVDVMVDPEPPPSHPLLKLDNFLVTPHVAFFSQEAVLELEERGAGEVARVLQGQMPDNLVNPAVLGRSRAGLQAS